MPARRVLIIDDSAVCRAELEEAFTSRGWDVTTAGDGVSGLALAEAEGPDLVLLDVVMPVMDGWETCRKLRALEIMRSRPVIIMSTKSASGEVLRAFEVGADDYFEKPMDVDELFETVEGLIGK